MINSLAAVSSYTTDNIVVVSELISNKEAKLFTFEVEEVDTSSKSLEETHVDEDSGGVELDVARILGAVVRVVPLVGRQQQLHERVGRVGVTERRVVGRTQSDTRHRL